MRTGPPEWPRGVSSSHHILGATIFGGTSRPGHRDSGGNCVGGRRSLLSDYRCRVAAGTRVTSEPRLRLNLAASAN